MSFLQQIQHGTWVVKDVFQLPQWLLNATGSPEQWFLGIPVVRDLIESVVGIRHAFEDLRVHATESGQELLGMSGTILDTLKSFIETAPAINRAFNSKVHPNPTGTGNSQLTRLRVSNDEVIIYIKNLGFNNKDYLKIGKKLSIF
jgi:hypothetical protein